MNGLVVLGTIGIINTPLKVQTGKYTGHICYIAMYEAFVVNDGDVNNFSWINRIGKYQREKKINRSSSSTKFQYKRDNMSCI